MFTYTSPFLLSAKGSIMATAYGCSNKCVTHNGKTHVVWLDAVARVCGRTYDIASGRWDETHYLFDGCDDHTTPALALDGRGHLHLTYGPHGYWGHWNSGCFKATVSAAPGIMDRWEGDFNFGYLGTYASVVVMPDGRNAIVYRGGERPAALMFQRHGSRGGWEHARALLRQDIEPQYTHYGGILACANDGTLYAGCHFYNTGGATGPGRSHGVAVIKSTDAGDTWSDMRGAPLQTPSLYEERIAVPPCGEYLYMNGLAVDSRGTPWALTSKPAIDDERLLLSHWNGSQWVTTDLQTMLPAGRVVVNATMTIDTGDRIHLALAAVDKRKALSVDAWGDPSSAIFHLLTDGTLAGSTTTIVAFGDSTTAPRGPLTVYADILRRELPQHGLDAEVINSGVGGNTTEDGRNRWQTAVLDHKPAITIIQFGINDAAVDVHKDPPATAPRVPLGRYGENLEHFINSLRKHACQPLLMTPNALRWTPRMLELYGRPPYRPDDVDGFNVLLRDYAATVCSIAHKHGVPLIDIFNIYQEYNVDGATADSLLLDGMHPNEAGHRLAADLLLRQILVLKSKS